MSLTNQFAYRPINKTVRAIVEPVKETPKQLNMDNLIIGKILKSKKAWYCLSAILIPIVATKLGVDEASVQNVFYAILTLIGAQGIADWGKEKK